MREFKLSKIWILSDIAKKGNVFSFSPHRNLIMSLNENSVGKSSLVKSILWTLGCEPYFDKDWKALDVSCCLIFSINEIEYTIYRKKNIFLVIKDEEKFYFNNFRKYVEFFCDLVNFFPMLENRKSKLLELPSPVYYFVPFYIDQKKGWASILKSFDKLTQYSNWYKSTLYYHCGITNNEISKIDFKISQKNAEILICEKNKEKAENALDIFTQINEENNIDSLLSAEIEKSIEIINTQYSQLVDIQNNLLLELSSEKNIFYDLKNQRNYSLKLAHEMELDFIYTSENFTKNKIECPLCGVNHNNTILERSLLIKDSDNLQNFIFSIENQMTLSKERINSLKIDLQSLSEQITNLQKQIPLDSKKIVLCANKQNSFDLVEEKTNTIISNENINIKELQDVIAVLNTEKDSVDVKFTSSKINTEFRNKFKELNTYLNTDYSTETINKSNILAYNIFDINGGAADSTRSVFLYHSIIINLINEYSTEVIAPFIIDTPNQQEQAIVNYEKIINTLINKMPQNMQIILCAMDNPTLENYKKDAHVITLTNFKSLLNSDSYISVAKKFELFNNEIKSMEVEVI